jgi:hypothetical protein
MINLPKTVTEKFYISYCRFTGAVWLTAYPSPDNVQLGTTEVTVDVPQLTQEQMNQNCINALVAQADELKAKTSARLDEINDKINQLKCIEHNPTEQDISS